MSIKHADRRKPFNSERESPAAGASVGAICLGELQCFL